MPDHFHKFLLGSVRWLRTGWTGHAGEYYEWEENKQNTHTHTKKNPLSIYIITESHFYLRNLPPPIMEISRYSYMSSLDVCLRIIRNFNLAPIRTGLRSPTDPRFRNDHASLVFHVAHFTSRPSEKNSWYSMQQLSMTHIFMFSLLWWPLVVVAVITGAKEEVTVSQYH